MRLAPSPGRAAGAGVGRRVGGPGARGLEAVPGPRVVSWADLGRASTARPAAFHGRDLPDPATRAVWVFEVAEPALVLGSTQRPDVVRPGAGLEVVRRRSGGGAVLLVPGEVLWVDVIAARVATRSGTTTSAAPRTGSGRSGSRRWPRVGVAGAEVHRRGLVCTPWCSLVCFAGLGPGEVTRRRGQGGRHQPAPHPGRRRGSSAPCTGAGTRRPSSRLWPSPDRRPPTWPVSCSRSTCPSPTWRRPSWSR